MGIGCNSSYGYDYANKVKKKNQNLYKTIHMISVSKILKCSSTEISNTAHGN